MKLARRTFIGSSLATLGWHGAAQPIKNTAPNGNVLDFESAGGSTTNTGDKNRRAYLNAVSKLDRAGGGTLVIPPKVFPFSGDADAAATNVTIIATGATFTGDDCRITIPAQSTSYNIHGLSIVETSGSSQTFLLNCFGTKCDFKDLHMEKNPPAGGYIAYCRENTSDNLFENVSFKGSNGIYLGGRNHEIRGGWAEAFGGDDCWVLKASTAPCENVRISGFRARGFASLISIGSEVGSPQQDDPSRSRYVRGVSVEDCTAIDCTYFAYIKPGGVQSSDYRDGVVEDVTVSRCTIEDPVGKRFRNGVYASPGRGAIIRRLTLDNLTVLARGKSPAVQHVAAVYLHVLNTADGAEIGGVIDDVTIAGLRCTDPYEGQAESRTKPGTPVHVEIAIEKQAETVGTVGKVQVVGASTDGCARMAVYVGPNLEGPIGVSDSEFKNFAAAIQASSDAKAIVAYSTVQVSNVTAVPSPTAPPGTVGLPG